MTDNTARELRGLLDQLKQSIPNIPQISSKIQQLEESQACHYCKDELALTRRALEKGDVELAVKALEAGSIKFDKLNGLVTELESKKLLGIDDIIQQKYGSISSPSPMLSTSKGSDDLGIKDVFLDAAELLQDVKEIGDMLSPSDIFASLPKPDNIFKGLKLPDRPPFLPPLPHELMFKEKK